MKTGLLIGMLVVNFLFAGGTEDLHYTKTGSGEAVLFFPALGCPGEIWKSTVEKLSSEYTCYTIEIPGFAGNQASSAQDYNKLLDQIKDLTTKEKIDKITLIGHSFGGYLALKFAVKFPEKTDKLIIVDSYPCTMGLVNAEITKDLLAAQVSQIKTVYESLTDEQFYNMQNANLSQAVTAKDDLIKLIDYYKKSDKKTIINSSLEMMSADLRKDLSAISAKTLVIVSLAGMKQFGFTKESLLVRVQSQFSEIKKLKTEIAENAKHFIMLDEPEWVNNIIKGFLL